MSLFTLPSTTEQAFVEYISSGYSGTYPVTKAFTVADYVAPLIIVKAAEFRQYEPDTHLYRGKAIVSVVTQIDDVEDPIAQHDNTVAEVYDLIADKDALSASVNAGGKHFHLVNGDIVSFDQDRDSANRLLLSMIELELLCQTLEP